MRGPRFHASFAAIPPEISGGPESSSRRSFPMAFTAGLTLERFRGYYSPLTNRTEESQDPPRGALAPATDTSAINRFATDMEQSDIRSDEQDQDYIAGDSTDTTLGEGTDPTPEKPVSTFVPDAQSRGTANSDADPASAPETPTCLLYTSDAADE